MVVVLFLLAILVGLALLVWFLRFCWILCQESFADLAHYVRQRRR